MRLLISLLFAIAIVTGVTVLTGCEQLTGTKPAAKCTAPGTINDTLSLRLDTLASDTIHLHLGGCP